MPFNYRVFSPKYHSLKKLLYYSICLILGGDEIKEEEVKVEILTVVVIVVVEEDIFVLFSEKIPTFDSPKSSRK